MIPTQHMAADYALRIMSSRNAVRLGHKVFIPCYTFKERLECDRCEEPTQAVVFVDPDVNNVRVPFELYCYDCALAGYGREWEAAYLEIVAKRMIE